MPYDPTIDRSIPQATPQGELIPTPPTLDQQRWELLLKDPSFKDRLMGGAETAAMVGTSPIGYLAGILGAGYGTVTGQDPRETGAKWEHASIYQPQTPVGQYYGEQVGEKLSALPPIISGIPHLSMGPKAGRFAAETYAKPVAEMAAELYAAGQLPGMINPASYIVKPEGNLNFTPTIRADMLKGPETQPVSSFLNQLPGLQGLTTTGLEHGLEKLRALDPNEKITKTALEDQLSPSQYKKVDLQGLSNAGIEHYFDQALENMDPHDVLHNMGLPQNLHSAAQDFLGGNVDHPPAALRPFLRRNGWLDREVFEDNFFQSERDLAHEQARDFAEADGPSRDYRDAQRLVDPDYTEDTYFEIGVKDPRYEGTYRHYEGAPQGTIGHVRGSFLPEPYMDERVAIEGTSLHNFGINDPGAMLIEEIQSDASKGVKQTGPLHQVHGVLFKAAVQHALENGATTVYMPTSKLIANVRRRPSSDYAPIYDQQIVKEGINPLKKIPGVTVTEMFDDGGENHVMYKIDFAPEAIEYILRGEGQKLPGYADGGQVEKDDAPPEGYRWQYFGDPSRDQASGRYPVPIETATAIAEPNRDVIGTSAAPSLPTTAPELQPEPSRDIVPHRYVAGEIPGGPAPEPTLDQMKYELARSNLTPAEWLMGAGENAASILTSPLGMLGGYAGLAYHTLRGAPFKEANARAADWAQASMYQPTTLAGQEIAEDYVHPVLSRLPLVISGIMPGLMRAPRGTTGALTAGVKRDIKQFDNDVFNAQRGITPGYPTMGSEFQKAFVEPRPNVYEMLAGIEPSNVPSTASAAIKTRGGNSPLSFGGDLKDSGKIGEHLNTLLSRVNPASVRQSAQINYFQPVAERWGNFLWNTKKLSDNEVSALTEPANANKYSQLLDEFALTHKEQFPQLKTLAELEKVEQAEKDFITGQYARYLTNDAGTGTKTDPFVRLAEKGVALPRIADKIAVMSPEELLKEANINALSRDVMSKTLERRGLEGKDAVKKTATTPLGQYVEGLSDDILFPINKQSYQDLLTIHKELGLPSQYADSPTPFERVSDKAPIWDVKDKAVSHLLGLPHLLDKLNADLRSGVIAPENIKNVSLESLLHSVIKEHKEKLAAEAKELSSFETLYQRPGSKNVWKNITDEANDDKTAAMHKRVADKMAICLGNPDYCQRAIDQEAFHSILFGPNGEPHVAVESRPSDIPHAFALLSNADKDLLNAETTKALGYTLSDALNAASPKRKRDFEDIRNELYTEFFGYPPEEIHQIKGKANSTTIDPKYIEDTRDFLNSREWLPSSNSSRDFNRNNVTLGGLVDTLYSDSLDAYAKRVRFSGYREVLSRFKAAELLGRKLPGRFATDKDITEFIKGPETLQYNHGSPISGLTSLGTDINRTRSADTGLWLAKSYKTAGTYAGMKGSIYGVEVQNKQLDVLDARNSPGGNIPLDSVIYHADGKQTQLSELAAHLGVTKLSTDDVARYAKNTGARGLHILNVGDVSGRANPFVNEAPDYADNLVIFNPRILKIIKEDKAPPFVPAVKVEKPLTEKQFYSRYSQHVDIRNRENQQGAETLKSIQESGWKPGFSVNTLPPYRGGTPTNVVDKKLAPRTGDYVYLVPNTFTTKTGNGLKINEGWTPKPYEAVRVTEDYPDMYKEYLKAFNVKAQGGAVRMAEGGQASKEDIMNLKPQPKAQDTSFASVRSLLADIGRNQEEYERIARGGSFDRKKFTPENIYAMRLLQAANQTPDPARYLESLNPYHSSQLQFELNPYSNVLGYVDPAEPNKAVIQRLEQVENTIPHELTHTLQLGRGAAVEKGGIDNLIEMSRSENLARRKTALPEEMRKSVFPSANVNNTREIWANVNARAHLVNAAGGDFINSPEGRALFPTNTEQRDYYAKAMPSVNSITPDTGTFVPNRSNPNESYAAKVRRKLGMADGGAVTDTLDKMVKNPQASTLLNLDLPNLIAAKQQTRALKRGGKVEFSNNIDDMRYALTRRQG